MSDTGRKVPQTPEGERGVLGAMLLSAEALDKSLAQLDETFFYTPGHSKIFTVASELYADGKPVDVITVTDKLERKKELEKIGGRLYITNLVNEIIAPSHIDYYIRLVVETAIRRKLIETSTQIIEKSYERLPRKDILSSSLKKYSYILISEDLDEAIRIGDRIAVMKDGKLVQYDTPEAIMPKSPLPSIQLNSDPSKYSPTFSIFSRSSI